MFKARSVYDSDDEPIATHKDCPDCGHRKCLSVWADGGTYCHSCGASSKSSDSDDIIITTRSNMEEKKRGLIRDGEFLSAGLPKRKLTAETLKKFGVKLATVSGKRALLFPYRSAEDGELAAQKVRFEDKEMFMAGDTKQPLQLFGQHLWNQGRKLVVTEGEFDAMAVSQLQQHKWPVVSIGGGSKTAKDHLLLNISYLEKFDEVILMFDMDDAGQKAARDAARALSPYMTVKIASLTENDPNDCLMAGKGHEVTSAVFNASEYRPEGVADMASLRQEWINQEVTTAVPYPWDGLTAVTIGIRPGEITTLTAGSGVGKTQVCMEIVHSLVSKHGKRCGLLFREQSWKRSVDGLIGLMIGKRIHISRATRGLPDEVKDVVSKRQKIEEFDEEEALAAFDKLAETNSIVFDKHWGSENFDELLSKIRYMAVVKKCDVVVLDHISIIVSGLDIDNERKALDVGMTKLRELCEATGVSLIIVSHLRRPKGERGFDEGLEVSQSHLRGSGGIEQLSDVIIALQRNKRDPEKRLWTEIVVLKNRFSGDDGVTACWLRWDEDTGRLVEDTPDFPDDKGKQPRGFTPAEEKELGF